MGCIVLVLGVGRCAFRPPRVVFVLGSGSGSPDFTTKRTSERAPSRSIQSAGAHRLRAERQRRLTERPDYAKAADTGPP